LQNGKQSKKEKFSNIVANGIKIDRNGKVLDRLNFLMDLFMKELLKIRSHMAKAG
jgi:hypothetical protein